MENNIDYQKLYKRSEFLNLIRGYEYTTVDLNENNEYVIVDKKTNSELTDEECLLNTYLDDILCKSKVKNLKKNIPREKKGDQQ